MAIEHNQLDEKKITHMLDIDIRNIYSDQNYFTLSLFRLMLKADPTNRRKLKSVYPNEYEVLVRAGFFEG